MATRIAAPRRDQHDHDALLCGVDDVAPQYERVDARDVLTTGGLKLEPGTDTAMP